MKPFSLEWWWSLYDLAIYRTDRDGYPAHDVIHYRNLADWIRGRIERKIINKETNA